VSGYTVGDDDDDLDQQVGRSDTYGPVAGNQLDLSAILEPDCDGDGFGDETQDPDVPLGGPCPKGTRTVILDANKNKVKKGRKVRLSGQLTEVVKQVCQSGQTVELQRKKKRAPDTAFSTFRALQTEQAGNFATRVKVKKTFEFRAQVPETATCAGQVSNTEKVKVKKK
jgi:hypothetical protein